MARKNLFDFATKELSQDAFLRWLLENYSDPIVGKASKKLLKEFISLYPKQIFDVEKITSITTLGQFKHMDIIANVEAEGKLYTFVIEDKTDSCEHDNQLKIYKDIIEKEYKSTTRYYIFYKTNYLDYKEEDRTDEAEWQVLNIEKIAKIFEEFKDSECEILSDYSNYVCTLYKKLSEVSDANIINWDLYEWQGYVKKILIPLINEKFDNKIEIYSWLFQNRYLSIGLYFPHPFFGNKKPLLEITFSRNHLIYGALRIEKKIDNNTYEWNIEESDEEFVKIINDMIMENKMPSLKQYRKKKCVAILKKHLEMSDIKTITDSILQYTKEMFDAFTGEYNKLY